MTKQKFLSELKKALSGLPDKDVKESFEYYSEIIDDRIEEGLTEEEAVLEIGSVDDIASQILADIPADKTDKKTTKSKRQLKAWEIVLLALGSPIWLSLAIAAFAVILSIYVVLWSVVISIWAVFGSFIGVSVGGVIGGVAFICQGGALSGIAVIGAGIVCAGFAILLFFGSAAATKGIFFLTKKIALYIKKCFTKKEGV